jgi:hypothetical protein
MPVILDPDSYDLWLDPGMTNVEAVSEILNGAPCPLGHYMEWRRSTRRDRAAIPAMKMAGLHTRNQ